MKKRDIAFIFLFLILIIFTSFNYLWVNEKSYSLNIYDVDRVTYSDDIVIEDGEIIQSIVNAINHSEYKRKEDILYYGNFIKISLKEGRGVLLLSTDVDDLRFPRGNIDLDDRVFVFVYLLDENNELSVQEYMFNNKDLACFINELNFYETSKVRRINDILINEVNDIIKSGEYDQLLISNQANIRIPDPKEGEPRW